MPLEEVMKLCELEHCLRRVQSYFYPWLIYDCKHSCLLCDCAFNMIVDILVDSFCRCQKQCVLILTTGLDSKIRTVCVA